MSQTIAANPRPSSGFLMSLIVSLLAPIFLGVTAGDIALARMAAAETVEDFRARNHVDLIAVAQIIANGLAVVGSLSRSLEDGLSDSMTLRLRGNAISLNRAAEQNRRVLRQNRDADPVAFRTESLPEPAPSVWAPEAEPAPEREEFLTAGAADFLASEAAARLLHPVEQATVEAQEVLLDPRAAEIEPSEPDEEKQYRRMQAKVALNEVNDLADSLRTLPQAERAAVEIRIAALGRGIRDLLAGPPPSIDDADDSPVGHPAGMDQTRERSAPAQAS